jgi:hypothetical protein
MPIGVNLSPGDWKRTRFASRYAIAAIKTKSAYRAMLWEHLSEAVASLRASATQSAARSAPRGITENQGSFNPCLAGFGCVAAVSTAQLINFQRCLLL